MAEKFTVSSRTSYGNRVGNSFKKIFTGILLLIGSIVLLAWNENNFVKEKAALNEGSKLVVEIANAPVDIQYDNQLVYLNGNTHSPEEILSDTEFGIQTADLKLERMVEMYQREEDSTTETKDNWGGSETQETTYEYKKIWTDREIDSSGFYQEVGHSNPVYREYESEKWSKSPILLGDFTLSESFVGQLSNYQKISLVGQEVVIPEKYLNLATIQNIATSDTVVEGEEIQDDSENISDSEELLLDSELGASESAAIVETENDPNAKNQPRFHVLKNMIYIGKDPQAPAVGDLRITFSTVKAGMVSVVGQQKGESLTSYTTSNGKKIALLEQGQVSQDTMFANAHASNKMMTWILRILGLVLMFIAFSMIFEIIETLAKIIPPLANILGMGTSLMALVLTLVIGFLTIALAWIVVRPLVGVGLLIVGIGSAIAVVKLKKKNSLEKSGENPSEKDPQ